MLRLKLKVYLITCALLLGTFGILFYSFNHRFLADIIDTGESKVENLKSNWQEYENKGSTILMPNIPQYEKFELTFDISWYYNRDFSNPNQKYDRIAEGKVNPFWPYEANPSSNDYWKNNRLEWDSNAQYTEGASHVQKTRDNVTKYYAAKQSTPRIWQEGEKYYKWTVVKYSDNNLYLNVAASDSGDIANELNKPTGIYSVWQLKGPMSDFLEPGIGASWKQYWQEIPSNYEAVPAGKGISVDGLFTNPATGEVITQPGFLYQAYSEDGKLPIQKGVWKIRFSPTQLATSTKPWIYNIRIKDSTGTTHYNSPENNFSVISSDNHGFVRVSPSDSRYFETTDGTYLPLIGVNNATSDQFPLLSQQGINFNRPWWQSSDVNFPLWGAGGQGGFLLYPKTNLSTDEVAPGKLVSSVLPICNNNQWDCFYLQPNIKRSTKMRFSALIKTVSITGSDDYGVYLYESFSGGTASTKLKGDQDWQWVSIDFTIDNQDRADLFFRTSNVSQGAAYVSAMSLKEVNNDGSLGVELLAVPDFSIQANFRSDIAWRLDKEVEQAKRYGIYLKPVIEEKGDSFYQRIQQDGTFSGASNDNVYAKPNHASRIYQQYYWRYLIARYGYSTAIHSFELFNEGDPNSVAHAEATATFGKYLKDHDPNKRIGSTSNWLSFPVSMWSNSDIGNADIHRYTGYNTVAGGNRIWPGWDGHLAFSSDATSPGNGFEFDTSVAKSGANSFKITVPSKIGSNTNELNQANLTSDLAAVPGHEIELSFWAKGSNLKNYPSENWIYPGGLALQYSMGGGDFAGYTDGNGTSSVPWNVTEDWTKYTYTFSVPQAAYSNGNKPYILWVNIYSRTNNDVSPGYLWLDDIIFSDKTSGKVLNYNGGFEYTQSIGYDLVANHLSYSTILNGFDINKPIIRGETGVTHKPRFGSSYKGVSRPITGDGSAEFDQHFLNDINGIWWKKWVWSHIDAGGLIEMLWFTNGLLDPNIGGNFPSYGRSYQNFMKEIALTNGKYKDLEGLTSTPNLRIIGQKEINPITQKATRAHAWIDNAPYNWKAVADNNFNINSTDLVYSNSKRYTEDSIATSSSPLKIYKSIKDDDWNENFQNQGRGLANTAYWQEITLDEALSLMQIDTYQAALPSPSSGDITIPNMQPLETYKLEWWDTTESDISKQVINSSHLASQATSNENGDLTFRLDNLVSDIALKISILDNTPLKLTKTASANNASQGQELTYTLTVENPASTPVTNVIISDQIPLQISFISEPTISNVNYDSLSRTLRWEVGTLAPGAQQEIQFKVMVE